MKKYSSAFCTALLGLAYLRSSHFRISKQPLASPSQ